jgi:hypothetical protein
MTVLLTGWSGPALATTRGWSTVGAIDTPPAHHRSLEISYTLTRDRGSVRLAAAGAFSMQKTVMPAGSTDATVECGGDVVSIAATHVAVVVTRGNRSVTVNVNGGHERSWTACVRSCSGRLPPAPCARSPPYSRNQPWTRPRGPVSGSQEPSSPRSRVTKARYAA